MVPVLKTAVTELLGIEVPVVGAPMAGVAGGRLAAAVSAGGGLGMVGVEASARAHDIAAQAAAAGAGGRGFGIGLLAWALAERPDQLDAALAAGPALVSVSFGDYARWVEPLHAGGVVVATQVATTEQARAAAGRGVDVIVARGGEGGGHGENTMATLPLLQGVLDAVEVPVLAAGGIVSARGLAAVLAAGAGGAWVGTALLSSVEGANAAGAKARVRQAGEGETVYSRVFDIAQGLGWPPRYGGRALRNAFTDRWVGHEDELSRDDGAREEIAAARRRGDFDVAGIYAGQGVGLVTEHRSAADVVTDMAVGARELLTRPW